jgi:uncharacterized RDD family membrane protein YckC
MEFSTFQGPQQTVPDLPVEGVGFLLRALAKIIDLVIHNVIGIPLGFLIGVIIGYLATSMGTPVPSFTSDDVSWQLINGAFAITGFIFYCAICEAYYGATLGKMILGLFVVNKKGEQISFGAGLVRSLLFFIDSFFFGLPAYTVMKDSPLRQRIGDRAAGTVVIKRSEVRSSEIPSGCMLVIVLVIGLLFDSVVQVLPVFLLLASGQ